MQIHCSLRRSWWLRGVFIFGKTEILRPLVLSEVVGGDMSASRDMENGVQFQSLTNYPESSWINGFIMVDRSPVSKYTPQRSMLNSVLVSFQQRFFNNTLFKFNTRWSQSVHRRLVSWQTMASTPLESTHAALAVTEEADAGVASSAATGACKLVLWPGHSLLLFFFLLSPSTCLSLLRLSVSRHGQ